MIWSASVFKGHVSRGMCILLVLVLILLVLILVVVDSDSVSIHYIRYVGMFLMEVLSEAPSSTDVHSVIGCILAL